MNGVDTEGQRLLLAVPGSLAELAAQVGCSRQTVANWRRGLKLPEPHHRAKIYGAWMIPAEAWTLSPHAPPTVEPPTPAEAKGEPLAAEGEPERAPTTMEGCLALLQSIRTARQRDGLAPGERVKLADTEARILALRHRLEKEQELLEHRIVLEHPMWQRLKRTLVRVLVQYPEAAQAVAAALADVEGVPTPSPKSA